MLSVKVAYDNETKEPIADLLAAKGNPLFEFFNEDDPKQIKKAWKYKSSAGARQLPFIGIYEEDKLVKAFYAEDNSAKGRNFFDWYEKYIRENAKSGYMTITKVTGTHNERYVEGSKQAGYTSNFIEGISLLLVEGDHWFRTSPVVSIDWESKTFKTCNSTYSFELNEEKKFPSQSEQKD